VVNESQRPPPAAVHGIAPGTYTVEDSGAPALTGGSGIDHHQCYFNK
ncbi:hypothetical protein A2U01_0116435, partial [Trifolium medium]|nr:hypothetical protein [Trifolium medium]